MTAYFVRTGGDNNATGLSDAAAWATPGKAQTALQGSNTGHAVHLRCGDTWTFTTFTNTWSGSDENNLGKLGMYYMSGGSPVTTGQPSGNRPRIKSAFFGYWQSSQTIATGEKIYPNPANGKLYQCDSGGQLAATLGTWSTTTGATFSNGGATLRCLGPILNFYDYSGVCNKGAGTNNFKVENVHFSNHWGRGINLDDTTAAGTKFWYVDCEITDIGQEALGTHRNITYVTMDGCVCTRIGHIAVIGNYGAPGWLSLLAAAGGASSYTNNHHEVKNSIFKDCAREGVISNNNNSFHDNTVFNTYTGVYIHDGQFNTVYNNIIIGSSQSFWHRFTVGATYYSGMGILYGQEVISTIQNDNNDCWDNLIAYQYYGIQLSGPSVVNAQGATMYNFRNSYIVHNTFVDCYYNIGDWGGGAYNNSSFIEDNAFPKYTTGTGNLINNPTGITYRYNLWPATPPAPYSGTGDVIASNAQLTKQSGWQSMTAYTDVVATDFVLLSNSPARNVGLYLASFNVDYNGNLRASGSTDMGAIEFASAPADTEAPTVPTNLAFGSATTTSLTFSWTASTDNTAVTGYRIKQDGVVVNSVPASPTSLTISGLAAGTTYAISVSAFDAAGNESAYCTPVNMTTTMPVDNTAPTFSGVSGVSVDAAGVITLTWTQATDNVTAQNAIDYIVYQSTTSGSFNTNLIDTIVTGVGSVNIPWHWPGKTYFMVRARDLSGNIDTNTAQVECTVPQLTSFRTSRTRIRGRFS